MKKPLVIVASVLLCLIVIVPLGLWLFLDANQFRPTLESSLGDALGRKVTIGNLHVALFSGSIAVDNLAIADDPAFSTEPFVTAQAVRVGVDMMPLILSRSLRVQSFRLEQPHVALWRSPSGGWNFSKLGSSAPSQKSSPSATAMSLLIQKIIIANGRVSIGNLAARDKVRTYDDVNVEVTDLSYTTKFPFTLTAKTPGGGTADIKGDAGPVNITDTADTPVHANLDVKHLDLATTGLIDSSSGLAGVVDFAGTMASDGKTVSSKGKMTASKMQLMPGSSPARVPVEIDYTTDYTPATQKGRLTQGDVHVGKAVAHMTGDFDVRPDSPVLRMKLTGQQMPVTELEAALPALGITLPSGASLKQGTMDTTLGIDGRIDRLVISGPIALANATLAGFDLGAKLGAMASLAGLPKSGETSIQSMNAKVRVAPDGTQVDDLSLVAPAIGSLTGAGTVAPKGALAFKMLAKLSSANAVTGSVARVASLGQPANGIPFHIGGTTSNPTFSPDVTGTVTNVLKSPETATKAADLIGGLFKKKK